MSHIFLVFLLIGNAPIVEMKLWPIKSMSMIGHVPYFVITVMRELSVRRFMKIMMIKGNTVEWTGDYWQWKK